MESMSCTDLRDLSHGGSFSFSCSESDLNFSSLSHFTDDDDGDGMSGDDDDESYIEIALDHHDHPKPSCDQDDDDDVGGLNHVDYLRISFSSSLLQELCTHTQQNISEPPNDQPVNQTTSSSASCTLSSSSTETSCGARKEGSDQDSSSLQTSTATKRGRLPAVNGLVNTLLFGLRSSSELPIHADNADVARSRKATNMRSSINGGIMKLLFKFRAMNLGALVASVVKPRQVACDHSRLKKKKKKSRESVLLKPLDKWLEQKKQGKRKASEEGEGEEKYSRVLQINLGAVRGVLEAFGNSMSTGIGRKDRRTRSCPSSTKSSPIHKGFASDERNKVCVYARETSIQAAIAHCKTSFEQPPKSP